MSRGGAICGVTNRHDKQVDPADCAVGHAADDPTLDVCSGVVLGMRRNLRFPF